MAIQAAVTLTSVKPFSAVSPKKEALEGHLLMFPTRDNNDGCKAQFWVSHATQVLFLICDPLSEEQREIGSTIDDGDIDGETVSVSECHECQSSSSINHHYLGLHLIRNSSFAFLAVSYDFWWNGLNWEKCGIRIRLCCRTNMCTKIVHKTHIKRVFASNCYKQ